MSTTPTMRRAATLTAALALLSHSAVAQQVATSPPAQARTTVPLQAPYYGLNVPRACTQRIIGGHGYYFCPVSASYHAARDYCHAFGAELAIFSDRYENDAAAAVVRELGRGRHLIGYNDAAEEGTFVTANGAPMTFSGWAVGEPNNAGDEDSVELDASGIWNDIRDGSAPNVLCEEAAACNTEMFGDHLYHFCRTAPSDEPATVCRQMGGVVAQLDTIAEERFVSEHAGAIGLTCSRESPVGRGAVVCETERPCVRRFYNGTMYELCVREGATANDARRACDRMGFDLATITDAAMNGWLYSNFALFRRTHFYIDLRDDDREGAFYTRLGPATFTAWAPNEPNNQNEEDCVETADQGWNDVPCNTAPRGAFVCQWRVPAAR